MTEREAVFDPQREPADALNERLEHLERESHEFRQRAEERVIQAEMKVEALRAGMVDLDGLKFLDLGRLRLEDNGNVTGGAELISQLKGSKPWLFALPMSSSIARTPASKPTRAKPVSEMTDDEYRVARANIIRRATF